MPSSACTVEVRCIINIEIYINVHTSKDKNVSEIESMNRIFKKGKKVTESFISNTRNYIENKYKKDGYLNAKVTIATAVDTSDTNAESMVVNIKTGDKVKIKKITIDGNKMLSDKQLRKALKNTKKQQFGRVWKKSKYIEADYKEDLSAMVDKYAEKGYRDARVLTDSISILNDKKINIDIKVEEGKDVRKHKRQSCHCRNGVHQVRSPLG